MPDSRGQFVDGLFLTVTVCVRSPLAAALTTLAVHRPCAQLVGLSFLSAACWFVFALLFLSLRSLQPLPFLLRFFGLAALFLISLAAFHFHAFGLAFCSARQPP